MAPSRPHFFKIMMADFSKHLRIPPAFVKYFQKEGSQSAILVGPSRGHWRIKLISSRRGLYIQHGWEEFVKDHSLQEYDFLLFRYDGDMHFAVQIFDRTACEREDAYTVKANQEYLISEERKKRARMVDNASVSSDLAQTKSNRMEAMEHKKCRCSVHGGEVNSRKLCANVEVKEEVDHGEVENGEVWEDYHSFTSKNPFFITRMAERHIVRTMTVALPTKFRTDHLPHGSREIVLQDPKGRSWKVKYIQSAMGILSAGWSAFSRNNNLKVGDMCIFELVDKLKLQVHIFRGERSTCR